MSLRQDFFNRFYDMPLVRREVVKDSDPSNPFDNSVESIMFDYKVAGRCSIQNISEEDLKVLPEGLDYTNTFTVYTDTMLSTSINGTPKLGDSLYIFPAWFTQLHPDQAEQLAGWYTVVKPKYCSMAVNFCTAYLHKDNSVTDKDVENYPMDRVALIKDDLTEKTSFSDTSIQEIWLNG